MAEDQWNQLIGNYTDLPASSEYRLSLETWVGC